MLAKTFSCGLDGLEAYPVVIEADITSGLPAVTIVGLPDNAVKESRERVRAAIKNSGFSFPPQRITINLAPADIRKEGPSFDLAIALSILAASEQIPLTHLNKYIFLGELSLDGHVSPVSGVLSAAMAVTALKYEGLIVPLGNAEEAALAGCPVFAVSHLNDVVKFLLEPASLQATEARFDPGQDTFPYKGPDFSDVKGQAYLKRGLEIAAAGGHNVILIGAPGSGKTMLARRLTGILPHMTKKEALEAIQIHSAAGVIRKFSASTLGQRPFRSPHHTASNIALIGGGTNPKPGEVTLANHGVLFLDEFLEFNRHVLEVLRQPLEDGYVNVARARGSVRFPARFMLVAAMNPCPCGWRDVPGKSCRCSSLEVERYRQKMSGPLLDRIDIHLTALPLKTPEMFDEQLSEASSVIRERTTKARQAQWQRFNGADVLCNAHMNKYYLKECCALDRDSQKLLSQAIDRLKFSARAHDKILKVARTIADLEGQQNIQTPHIAEAISYRTLDRMAQ